MAFAPVRDDKPCSAQASTAILNPMPKKKPARKLGHPAPCGSPWSRQRARKGWTLAVLAHMTKLSLSYLCEVERGRVRPGLQALLALARVYRLDLMDAAKLSDATAKWRDANVKRAA